MDRALLTFSELLQQVHLGKTALRTSAGATPATSEFGGILGRSKRVRSVPLNAMCVSLFRVCFPRRRT